MRTILVICAVVASFVVGLQVHSHATPRPTEPGMMPYTPTRLEWLALDLEALYRIPILSEGNYGVDYWAKPPNTIKIAVVYTHDASAGIVDLVIEQAKGLAKTDASSHGWPWVKIEVERKLAPLERGH